MPWFDTYRAYDDDTLTALANAGLLRRAAKDMEADKLAWIEQRDDGGAVAADGQRVELDARGPQHARCDCPAPGICKHILGAVLWLRALEPVAISLDGRVDEAQPLAAPAPSSALQEVLDLDAALLFKAAGIAAMRRAASTPVERLIWHDQAALLVLELPELGASCRWIAGAGFAGMVSEVPAAERSAVHLIAIAALRRERGRPLEWPAGAVALPRGDDGLPAMRELEFLDQVRAVLDELVAGGLSHVSDVTSARLFALSMSARGEGRPRLASLLRNLGGMADLLATRDHRVDERDVLSLMARIHALCTAYRTARGEIAEALRGKLRRDFDEAAALELLPLGAHWWQTRGGARGLTLAFWDIQGPRLLQAVLARPDSSDVSFTRQGAWKTHAVWQGAGPAEHICEAAVKLEQPRLADDRRLALGGVTRAQTMPAWPSDDKRIDTLGWDDWTLMTDRLRDAVGLTGTPLDAALLRPHAICAPRLDEVRQRFEWPVKDVNGRWLVLTIPCGQEHRERIDNLDRLIARGVTLRAVLVRIEQSIASTALIPVAVLINDASTRSLKTVSLDFAAEPARSTTLASRILRLFEARRETPPPSAAPTLAARLLAPIAEVLETQAETGRLLLTPTQTQTLQEAQSRMASVGLETLADALHMHLQQPSADTLLTLAWLCQLLGEIEGLPLPQ